jgi:hypothetical protein
LRLCWIDHRQNSSITISIYQFNKRTAKWTNNEGSLRRVDRTVLKDFPRNYTLIPQDLTDPSRCRIEETELTRKIISGRCNPRNHWKWGTCFLFWYYSKPSEKTMLIQYVSIHFIGSIFLLSQARIMPYNEPIKWTLCIALANKCSDKIVKKKQFYFHIQEI